MRKLDFYGLPRSLQDRFIESVRGAAVPTPVAVTKISDRRAASAAFICVAVLLAWLAFTAWGFGKLSSPLALGNTVTSAGHVLFGCAAVFWAIRAYGLSWETSRRPFAEGNYLFPSGIVTARATTLREFDPSQFTSAKAQGNRLTVQFSGGNTFEFSFADAERAEGARDILEKGIERWKGLAETEALERARLHPLVDSGVPNPLAPTIPHKKPVFMGVVLVVGTTLLFGAGLGFAVSRVRNSLSEKELYRAAVEQNTVDSYRAYLARGGKRPDVEDLFLPRAELELAMREASVEAIERFIAKNPKTKIGSEIEVIHRAALLSELAKAQKAGTLEAIEAIRKRFPAHGLIEPELKAARKAAFSQAWQAFQPQASVKNEALLPFVQDLLAYTEGKGAEVQVRWQHDFPQSRDMLDSIVSKSEKYYLGRKSLPVQYFTGEHAARRETALAEAIIERLQRAFPKDVVSFVYAGPAADINLDLPPIERPTLTLKHKESLSGGFVGGKPKGMYLGAAVGMSARFEIPGRAEPLTFHWDAWRAPNFSVLVDKDIPDVYEDMMGGAFDGFRQVYLKTWFSEP